MAIVDCYVRNSTVLQIDNWRAERQKNDLPEIVRHHGYEPVVWEEQGKTGETLNNRPKMLQILQRIKDGVSDGIACVDFGRLSRDIDMVEGMHIWRTCKEAGAVIVTPERLWRPGINSDDDIAFILIWQEGRNKRAIVEKTFDGIKQRAVFFPMFRGSAAYGYEPTIVQFNRPSGKTQSTKYWKIQPDEARVVREIFQLSVDHGPVWIAHYLNDKAKTDPTYKWRSKQNLKKKVHEPDVWATYQIKRILANPIYRGIFHVFKERNSSLYKSVPHKTFYLEDLKIVSDELAEAVQLARSSRHTSSRGRITPSRFGNIIRCPHCESPLVYVGSDRYACSKYWSKGRAGCLGILPGGQDILNALLPILQAEFDRLTDEEWIARTQALQEDRQAERQRLLSEKDSVEKAMVDFLEDFYTKRTLRVPEHLAKQMQDNWNNQLQAIDEKLAQIASKGSAEADPEILNWLQNWRHNLPEIMESASAPTLATFLGLVFKWVKVDWANPEKKRYKGIKVVEWVFQNAPTEVRTSQYVPSGWNSFDFVRHLYSLFAA